MARPKATPTHPTGTTTSGACNVEWPKGRVVGCWGPKHKCHKEEAEFVDGHLGGGAAKATCVGAPPQEPRGGAWPHVPPGGSPTSNHPSAKVATTRLGPQVLWAKVSLWRPPPPAWPGLWPQSRLHLGQEPQGVGGLGGTTAPPWPRPLGGWGK